MNLTLKELFKKAMHTGFRLFSELGYDIDIIFLRFRGEKAFDTIVLSHTEYDGVNGFVEVLKREDCFDPRVIPPIPQRATRKPVSRWLNYFWQYFRVLAQFGKPSRKWRQASQKVEKFAIAGKLLTLEQTQAVKKLAKETEVTVNTALLYELNRSIARRLDETANPNSWIVAVMLYEFAEETEENGSLTSIMEINIEDRDTPVSLHRQIRDELATESYMGTWLGAIINSFLPDDMNRSVLRSTVAKKMRVGTFTNLGRWNQIKINPGVMGWGVLPPVHPGQPLGVGALEFGGRIGLAVKVDPSLGLSDADADALLENWIRRFQ